VSLRRKVVGVTRIVPLLAIAAAVFADSRGVGLPARKAADAIETFDPKQSAALFVGVREFRYDSTLAEVRYALDDAIDLAFVFAIDERVRLVDPSRVILALSGDPQKPESRQNLDQLIASGAKVRPAGQAEILVALQEQANTAGKDGLLVVAFATHGVSYDGTQHLLTATSVLAHREMSISESKIRDIVARSDAARSLILVDACRERLVGDRRNGAPDRRSAASLIRAMSDAQGQVVLSAAAAGQYAYDDDVRRNGVFTAAVIDGLRCEAPADARGLVTVDALSTFVEKRILTWIRKQRGVSVAHATQVTYEGSTKTMPLAECRRKRSHKPSVGCTVSIASSPVGAKVFVDGKEIGATPLSSALAEGQRSKVVLVKPGYHSSASDVDCATGPVFVALEPRAGERQILFSESFDENRFWYTSSDPQSPARVAGGVYVLGSPSHQMRFSSTSVPIDQDSDFQIAVTARRLRGSLENNLGLIWGLADEKSMFFMAVNGKGNVQIGQMKDYRGTNLNDLNVVHPSVRTGTGVNRLKIAKVGKQLRFFVNDGLVHEMEFRPFFGPAVGLGAFCAYEGPIVAEFDDLTVEGIRR
jgi:hypothetical protein